MTDGQKTIYGLAFAAFALMVPWIGDPYVAPRYLAVALVAGWALCTRSNRESSLEPAFLGAAFLWCLVALAAQDLGAALVGQRLAGWDSLMAVGLYLAVFTAAVRSGAGEEQAVIALTWAALPMAGYAVAQRWMGNRDPFLLGSLPEGYRVISTQGGCVHLGACLALAVVISGRAWQLGQLRLPVVLLLLAVPALWFTGTRGAVIAAAVGLAVLVNWRAALGILATAAAALVYHPRAYATLADLGRLEVYRIAWRAFKAHPWLGYGPGTFEYAYRLFVSDRLLEYAGSVRKVQDNAHQELLNTLATGGMVGAIAYLALLGAVATYCYRKQWRFGWAVLACYAVVSSLNPVPASFYFAALLLLGCHSSRETVISQPRALPLFAALAGGILAFRVTAAEVLWARAHYVEPMHAVYRVELARRWNPWSSFMAAQQADALMLLMNKLPKEEHKGMAAYNVEVTRQLVAYHPLDPLAHEIYGRSLVVANIVGLKTDLGEASAHYTRAQELAPTFTPIMDRQLVLAQALHDQPTERKMRRDIARIERLIANGRKLWR